MTRDLTNIQVTHMYKFIHKTCKIHFTRRYYAYSQDSVEPSITNHPRKLI